MITYFHYNLTTLIFHPLRSRMLVHGWHSMIKNTPEGIDFLDRYLSLVQYPHSFNRQPKDFSNHMKWKASQLRTFLIYVSLPLLIRLRIKFPHSLPSIYVYHFSLFFIYIRTLRHYSDRQEIPRMIPVIEAYLELFASIFDKCKELLSVHSLFHLWEQVELHGGLAYHR